MTEGGLFAWKRQGIDVHRGPAGEYVSVHRPLPSPPKGMYWAQDESTKEWSLKKQEEDYIVAEVINGDHVDAPAFLEHEVTKSDTFAGICLRYKLTPTELRRANGGFSGTNLHLAPNPLRIPNTNGHTAPLSAHPVGTLSNQQKIAKVIDDCKGIASTEAKCYLELNDWNVEEAIANAHEDGF
eukprot:scaffold2253_cov119-Cylindrotheca_fusiformis.AAC.16